MCNRLCTTFSLKELQALIQLKNVKSVTGPNYVEIGTKLQPIQTYNASETSPCPVLLSEKHIFNGMSSKSTVLAIMQWSLSPSWVVEGQRPFTQRVKQVKKRSLDKNRTFQTLFEKGHRCVLVCEGFYQFISLGKKLGKQAYLIHLQNIFDARIQREIIRPCYIAALFDTQRQSDGRNLYAFTIVTVKTPKKFSQQIAPDMPAIFCNIDQVLDWIDFVRIDRNDALNLLENHEHFIEIDPVSNHVMRKNNTGSECITIVPDPNTKKSPTANIQTDDDVTVKVIDEKGSSKHDTDSVPKTEPQKSLQTNYEDTKHSDNTLRSTLEALSNRTTERRRQASVARKNNPFGSTAEDNKAFHNYQTSEF